jgi:hypothetical protein
MQFDPQKYWQSAQVAKDRFFFINIDGFDKFKFVDNPNEISVMGRIIYVVSPDQLPPEAKKLLTIYDLANLPVFDIGEQAL